MKSIRILKNLFLAAVVVVIIVQLWGAKISHFTEIESTILIIAAILFLLDAFYSKKR